MSITVCPMPAELERLFLGGLPQAETDALEQHVHGCSTCLATLAQLSAKDDLAGMLSRNSQSNAYATAPIVADLVKKLKSLPRATAFVQQGSPMITISCSACQKKLSVKEDLVGKKVKCPGCGQLTAVPARVAAAVGRDDRTLPPSVGDAPSQDQSVPATGEQPTHPPLDKPDVTQGVKADGGHDTSLTDFLAPPQSDDELGRLGAFRILKILGHGGMGVVFLGEDAKLSRKVAIKAMLPHLAQSKSSQQRFVREARAAAALEHDHIVPIFHVGEDRGAPYIVMPFLKGQPLDERLKADKPMPLVDILRIGREVAKGLGAAHAMGLIHRDIKPANIWLEAPEDRVKILDFGLARAATQEAGLTQAGAIIGTPAYMAPEQGRGDNVDHRCDLFSLGVVLYRMCTGHQPFHGKDTVSTLMAVAMNDPAAPLTINSTLPPELSDLVMKLLEKDIDKRVSSAAEVIQALQGMEKKLAMQRIAEEKTEAMNAGDPKHGITSRPRGKAARNVASRSEDASTCDLSPRRRPVALIVVALCAVFGMLTLGAGAVYYWQTNNGIVRIEIDDPNIKVAFDKDGPTITGADKKDIKLRAGEHGLHITRGDLEFDTDKFILKRGETVTLKIEFLKGVNLQAMLGDKVIGKAEVGIVPLDPAWLKMVSALPADKQVEAVKAELMKRNPGFDGKIVTHKIDGGGVVTALEFLTDDVTDISPVRALTELRDLHCGGTWTKESAAKGRLADLSPLRGMKLTVLNCANSRVSDLSPLKDTKVTFLDCTRTRVSDLSPLKDLKLTFLNCMGCSQVSDLSPLKDTKLTQLGCAYTKVSDVSPLKDMKLTALGCDFTPVSDLTPLRGMKLTTFSCDGAQVTDLSPLRGMPLKDLRCDFNKERDTEILRSFGKTLETINRKPAAQFWQEVDGTSPPPRTDAIVQKFLGHTDLVGRVALSGDGRYAVTGSWDGKAIVWETASGKIINTFQDRPKWLQCVAISYYGKYVLTGSNDQTATLWDAPSGKKLQTFEGHTGAVESVALSLEAYPKHVLTGSRDNTAILWDAASGKKLQAFLGHTGLVKSVALSDDGKLVLTGSADKTAILWEAASGKKIYTFLGHTDKVNGVALSGDAKLVLTGSRDTTAILWEASGKKIQTFRGHTSGITDVALRHDGKLALTGSFDGSAILWDAASANKLQTFRGHADGVGGVALTRAGNLVLTGSSDKTAILWAVNAGPWQPLLDDKLTGWTRHDNKKPDDIVVAQVESEPVLRMRRENKDVYVATKIEVENHHLRLEFRTPPGKKSSGLSSGIVTTPEGGTGFTFIVDSNGNVMPSTWGAKYSPGLIEGGAIVPKEGPVNFASAALKPAGAWNQLDLVRLKDGLLCFVNGRFIGAMAGMRYAKDGKEGAIARTLIHVHSQPGEVEVRRIEVRAISVLPPELVAKAPFPPLDPAWLKMVAALPADKQIEAVKAELMKRNPGFDGELQHIVGKDNAVTELKFSTDNVSDILPLRALQGLQKLNCNGTFPDRGKLSDLSPLKNMPLVHLYCPANPISNLGPLSEMKLTHLWVHYTLVADLSPLRGMKLTLLNCGHKVTDLTPLKGMPLKEIALDVALAKRNAELLRSIPTLETINLQPAEKVLSGANIAFPPLDPAWLKAVAAMKAEQQVEAVKAELMKRNPGFDGMMEYTLDKDGAVTHLRFVTDKVADISPVRVLTALKALHCNATSGKKAKLADLSPLSDLKLETLGINATQVADLAPLRHMNLKNLWVADSLVSDLAPIMGMKGDLKALGIGRTKVADLSPLKEMEKLETLLMEGTLVTDLSRLKGLNLKRLRMENTKVADIDPLKGMPLKELDISFQVKRDAEILRSITTLETINGQTRDAFWKEVDAKKGGK